MKTATTILALLLIALIGCGGGKSDNKKVQDQEDSLIELSVNSENSSEIIDSNISDDDPFSEIIAQYSPEELRQILGKTEPQDVTDLFLLLPESDYLLYLNFTVDQRRKMVKGERVSSYFGEMGLEEIDVRNGYLSSGYEGIWEMFAKKQEGVWHILVNEQNCGQFCSTVLAKTYTFANGKLIQRSHANLAGYQDLWVELFIDFDQLTQEQQAQANKIWGESSQGDEMTMPFSNVLFRLPRDGRTITMYIVKQPYIDAGIPESAFKKIAKDIGQ